MCRYKDETLVKYEEAIELHFDTTGTMAWLTMKNYWPVFWRYPWAAQRPNASPSERREPKVMKITIGIPVGKLDQPECELFSKKSGLSVDQVKNLKKHRRTFSISSWLEVFDVMKLQDWLLKFADCYSVGFIDWVGDQEWSPKQVRPAMTLEKIGQTIEVALGLMGFESITTPFVIGKVPAPFWPPKPNGCSLIDRRLRFLFKQARGAAWIQHQIQQNKRQKIPLIAYFPNAEFIIEEQRTTLRLGTETRGTGKTNHNDSRDITPIFDFTKDLVPSKPVYDPVPPEILAKFPAPIEHFSHEEMLHQLDEDYLDNPDAFLAIPGRSVMKPISFKKGAAYLHRHVPRINCYGFRGDKRPPWEIERGRGFMPGVLRNDEKYEEMIKEIDLALAVKDGGKRFREVMNKFNVLVLGAFTADAEFKGFVSTSTSTAIAKHFANEYAPRDKMFEPVFCYALRCKQGFHLPTHAKREIGNKQLWTKLIDGENTMVHNAEQEVAVPGGIGWDCVVGMRVLQIKPNGQFFTGPVFLCDSLRKEYQDAHPQSNPQGGQLAARPHIKVDDGAFEELFELFCGKSQGSNYGIAWSYDEAPFDCPQNLWQGRHTAWESREEAEHLASSSKRHG
jgi:hypothetical protein